MNKCEFCHESSADYCVVTSGNGHKTHRCMPCQQAWCFVKGNEFTLQRMLDAAQRYTIRNILNA